MSFLYLIYFCVAALTVCSTDAAINGHRQSTCRTTSVKQNFNITGILGQWYEYSAHNHDFEEGCDCLTSEVTALDATSIQISNCCQKTKISNETQTCNIGVNYARLTNPEKMEASFVYTRTGVTVESRVWVVDTDYENYMIVHGCDRASDEMEREVFWILSRGKEINATEVGKIEEVLKVNNVERNKIKKHRHGSNICKSERPQRGHSHSHSGQSHS